MLFSTLSGSMPWLIVRLPCGSMSTARTRWPDSLKATARLRAVVVFATPPFWFANAITLAGPLFLGVSGCFAGFVDSAAVFVAAVVDPAAVFVAAVDVFFDPFEDLLDLPGFPFSFLWGCGVTRSSGFLRPLSPAVSAAVFRRRLGIYARYFGPGARFPSLG